MKEQIEFEKERGPCAKCSDYHYGPCLPLYTVFHEDEVTEVRASSYENAAEIWLLRKRLYISHKKVKYFCYDELMDNENELLLKVDLEGNVKWMSVSVVHKIKERQIF